MIAFVGLATSDVQRHRIVVVGGTHGNEYTGCYVIERLEKQRKALRQAYPSLDIETLLANPRAYASNQRFLDDDLNRQFSLDRMADEPTSYEAVRAREIDAALGPKGSEAASEVCIDLHTTTANMGCTIIVNSYSSLALCAAAYLQAHWADHCCANADGWSSVDGEHPHEHHPLRVYLHDVAQDAAPYLCSVSRAGITVEVGPTPQGLLRADVVATSQRAVRLILRYLDLHYSGRAPEPPARMPVYVDKGKVPWPIDTEGSTLPGALVAASLQDRDFEPLEVGDPLFCMHDGSIVKYGGSNGAVVYPIFVNEAAYYYAQSGRGIGLTDRVDWPLTPP